MYPAWLEGLHGRGVDPEYRRSGLLVLPSYNLAKALNWASNCAEPIEELSAQWLEPSMACSSATLWMPRVAQVRNPRLLRCFAPNIGTASGCSA